MSDNSSDRRQLVVYIARSVPEDENSALRKWLENLLEIRASSISSIRKAKQAVAATAANKVIWPSIKQGFKFA
jgi:hypothetical protein